MKRLFICATALFLAGRSPVHAWSRSFLADDKLVEASELIVVAKLKESSIRLVRHLSENGGRGSGWHTEVVIEVEEVIKGKTAKGELPVTIHYGLDLAMGGKTSPESGFQLGEVYRTGGLEVTLWDSGGVVYPVCRDIRQKHVWFLRHKFLNASEGTGAKALGISEPQEVEPAAIGPYIQALLQKNSEPALRKLAQENTAAGARAGDFLGLRELEGIDAEKDAAKRFALLVPWLFDERHSRSQWAAQMMLREKREGDLQRLIKLYDSPEAARLRCDVLSMLQHDAPAEAEAFFVRVLKEETAYWSRLRTQGDDPLEPPPGAEGSRDKRWESQRLIDASIDTLGQMGTTPAALEAIHAWIDLAKQAGFEKRSLEKWVRAAVSVANRQKPQ
jgi:hypothetical protein